MSKIAAEICTALGVAPTADAVARVVAILEASKLMQPGPPSGDSQVVARQVPVSAAQMDAMDRFGHSRR